MGEPGLPHAPTVVAASPPRERWPFLRGARAAVVFLTRLPLGGFPYGPASWRWASAWFPLVGALVGLLTGVVYLLIEPAGPFVAAGVAVTASLMITGAFHEDGLADTADALGGAYDRAKLFVILKDSRIGSFGAAALIMSLLLRVCLLAQLSRLAPIALILAGALSRVPPVWMLARLPYVTAEDEARGRVVARAGAAQVIVATLFGAGALVTIALHPAWGLIEAAAVAVALAVVASLAAWRFVVRAGGVTGDFLGATQQLGEVTALLALILARAW